MKRKESIKLMKLFRILKRCISEGFHSVFKNFSLSMASIICTTITLILVAVALVISANVKNFTQEIEKDLTIVVYLDNKATEEDINYVKEELSLIDNIEQEETIFKSKDEVKEEMRAQSAVFDTVMKEWDADSNPLKDTFQIKVKDVEKINDTAKEIEGINTVTTVRYGEGMVEKMVNAFKWIQRAAYGTVIALVLVTVFLIVNTIKLTIFSRQTEIGIMRLVGASNFVIKTPFIIEGMFLGLLGAVIPVLIIMFGYTALYDYTSGYLFTPLIQLIKPIPFIYYSSGIIIVLGIIVGMIGSARASRKYLKV